MILNHKMSDGFDGLKPNRMVFLGGAPEGTPDNPIELPAEHVTGQVEGTPEDQADQTQEAGDQAIDNAVSGSGVDFSQDAFALKATKVDNSPMQEGAAMDSPLSSIGGGAPAAEQIAGSGVEANPDDTALRVAKVENKPMSEGGAVDTEMATITSTTHGKLEGQPEAAPAAQPDAPSAEMLAGAETILNQQEQEVARSAEVAFPNDEKAQTAYKGIMASVWKAIGNLKK